MLHSSSQTFQQKYARHVATVLVNYSLSLDELLDGLKKTIRLSEPRLDYVVVTTIYATRAFHFSESATKLEKTTANQHRRGKRNRVLQEARVKSWNRGGSEEGVREDKVKYEA